MPAAPHCSPAEGLFQQYGVHPKLGLTSDSVAEHTRRFGKNSLETKAPKSLWESIFEQFEDYLVRILLASAFISFVLAILGGSFETDGLAALVEPTVILVILILNAIIAIAQDGDSERALEELTRLQPVLAKVKRDGKWMEINAEDVVPGDIVEVRVGDKVPADARIIKLNSITFKVEQSGLTGENIAVEKTDLMLDAKENDCITDQHNMIFSATTVVAGNCSALVVATGMRTQIGLIQSAVMDADEETSKTPLGEKIDEFGEQLAHCIAVICLIVWIINYKHFTDPEHGGWVAGCIYYFKIAISLAVAAIPEGLPAVITTCLALGTRKMTMRNAIVRHLPSVETLGCTTVVCSDKTGTLTTNEMVVTDFALWSDDVNIKKFKASGTSFAPTGSIYEDGSRIPKGPLTADDVNLIWMARIAALCNNSSVICEEKSAYKRYIPKGEPTEAALLTLIEKLGCQEAVSSSKFLGTTTLTDNATPICNYWTSDWMKLITFDFDRERKSMSTFVRSESNRTEALLVKGAPEQILERSYTFMSKSGEVFGLTDESRLAMERLIEQYAKNGLRLIMLAIRVEVEELKGYDESRRHELKDLKPIDLERDLTIVGIVGMRDPPRPEVKSAIRKCKEAGIVVHMLTGDNQMTAEKIAKDIGIIPSHLGATVHSYIGSEFFSFPLTQQLDILRVSEGIVLSRMEPRHKQYIIKRLKELNHVIAMTGDGVNDAPALKNADIGISMGITGSAVAKEASDMILGDDNFHTIVAAIEEGRSIYNNMKAFIRYLISSNIGEVASIFITAAMGIPEGLTPVQLLWVNLVTDGPPATALGFNPPDVDVMERKPRSKDDPLISPWVFFRYCFIGFYVGIATVGSFIWWFVWDTDRGHTTVSLTDLMGWGECASWTDFKPYFNGSLHADPCSLFHEGKTTASTMCLSVLVLIEMLNALNAISEDHSLLRLPPWHNKWLLVAISFSLILHSVILYIPWFSKLFGVVPLGIKEWTVVALFSFPVIVIDEVLKLIARNGAWKSFYVATTNIGGARDVEMKSV